MFRKGLGVKRDDQLAYSLFLESVGGPDTPEIATNLSYRQSAYYWLGYMAEHGEGTRRDLKVANRWYKLGAALDQPGCAEAIIRLRNTARQTANKRNYPKTPACK